MSVGETSPGNQTPWVLEAVGRIGLVRAALEHVVVEVGRGLGRDLTVLDLGRGLEFDVTEDDLPPWADVTVLAVRTWLSEVAPYLARLVELTNAALWTRVGTQPWSHHEDDPSRRKIFTPDDYSTAARDGSDLVRRGEDLVGSLGLKNAGGGTTFGLRSIARSLYLQAIDRSVAPETAPARATTVVDDEVNPPTA